MPATKPNEKDALEYLQRAIQNLTDGDTWNAIEYALRAADALGEDDPDFGERVSDLIRQINGGF